MFVVESSSSFGWNYVRPASQTVAQHYFTIGPMYRVIRVQSPNSVSMLVQRRRRWPNNISQLGQCIVLSEYNHPILFQCCASVEYDWPALDQQWASTLAQHWTGIGWVGLHCVYQIHVHRIDAYTDLSAMVVEGIGLHVEDILVSLVFSIIISWPFRILVHEEKPIQLHVCLQNIRSIFCPKHLNRLKLIL